VSFGLARRAASRALLGRDPGEDPVEMRVLDDDPGSELRMVLGVEAGGKLLALGVQRLGRHLKTGQ
jgi:hypothetical protein